MQICFIMDQTLQWSTLPFTVWVITEDQTKAYPALVAVVSSSGGAKPGGTQGLPKHQAVDPDRLRCYQIV